MREDCRHFESRTYDSGEVARYCVLGLAPEQPWRCPEHCPKYEPSLIEGGMVTAPLARPPVEPEPDDDPAEIADVLQDAEAIVEAAEPDAIRELERPSGARKPWQFWKRRRPGDGDGDGDEFNLSSR
jgi:hypothetical protein